MKIYQFLQRHGLTLALCMAFLVSIVSVVVLNGSSISYDQARQKALQTQEVKQESDPEAQALVIRKMSNQMIQTSQKDGVGFLLGTSELFILISALLALLFPLYRAIAHPKSLLKTVVGLGVLVVLFGMAYATSSGSVVGVQPEDYTPGEAQFSGAIVGVIAMSVVVAVVVMLGGEIYRMIKQSN